MPLIKSFIIDVRCPYDHAIQKVEMKYTVLDNGTEFFFPCNGCENWYGSNICEPCKAALTLMYDRGYRHEPREIVSPDFSTLKSPRQ